jgi:dUTP pyrophosphatase
MSMEIILTHGAEVPQRGSKLSSGLDLTACGITYPDNLKETVWFDEHPEIEYVELLPMQRILVKTGVQIDMSSETKRMVNSVSTSLGIVDISSDYLTELQIRPRSGLALKNGITVLNTPGTIDADYKDMIGVILINTSNKPFIIKPKDRIAQGVFSLVPIHNSFEEVSEFTSNVNRNGGFGSTGVK